MKRFLFTLVLLLGAFPAEAREYKILFWSPGEIGTTAEAQPVIDAFTAHLSAHLKPDTVAGVYFNTIDEGIAFIKRSLPDVAIINYPTWISFRAKIPGAKTWLATRALPHGKTSEQFTLVGSIKILGENPLIVTNGTIPHRFLREELFPQLPAKAMISKTSQLLQQLRHIAEGELKGFALLNQLEISTLQKLNSPWTQKLVTVATSPLVPTARVVLMNPQMPQQEKLKQLLLKMEKTEKGKELLGEMRLMGFAPLSP